MKNLLILIFLLTLGSISAETYFVSENDNTHGKYDIRSKQINDIISNYLSNGDSILFKRGERFFGKINILRNASENITFSAYGDKELPKPILDGSIYHFNFDKDFHKDYVNINGIKFYKKQLKILGDVENIYIDNTMLTLAREPDADETIITGMNNSYTGFFKIDSVDTVDPRKKFYDKNNKIDWSGGEVVTKTSNFTAEVMKIVSNEDQMIELEDNVTKLRLNYGYFVQDHFKALDSMGEWYYDSSKGMLYFSTEITKGTLYLTGESKDDHQGVFNIDTNNNVTIKGLKIRNSYTAIQIRRAEKISIENNDLSNSNIGIDFFSYYTMNNSVIKGNSIRNMRSYGIHGKGNNNILENNTIKNIGMTYGSNAGGIYNLEGITIVGSANVIDYNDLSNIGYCGIKIYQGGSCKITNNKISNCSMRLADAGGIYAWHCFEGNKLVKNNIIKNILGNKEGTIDPSEYHARGIYLDELSLHFRLENNTVENCGEGIYVQNSRNDTLIGNICRNNRLTEMYFNSGGSILNGGSLNPENDICFDPNKLSDNDKKLFNWDKKEGLLYKNNKEYTIFVEPINNLIKDNKIEPNDSSFTFIFRTWRELNDKALFDLTGNNNFIVNNLAKGYTYADASLLLSTSHIRDYYNSGKGIKAGIINLDESKFKDLRDFKAEIIVGTRYNIER